MKNWLMVVMMSGSLFACSESAEERICSTAKGCGALPSGDVDACVDELASLEADRALEECADCLEASTCGEIRDGACSFACP